MQSFSQGYPRGYSNSEGSYFPSGYGDSKGFLPPSFADNPPPQHTTWTPPTHPDSALGNAPRSRAVANVAPSNVTGTMITVYVVWLLCNALLIGLAAGGIGLPYTGWIAGVSSVIQLVFTALSSWHLWKRRNLQKAYDRQHPIYDPPPARPRYPNIPIRDASFYQAPPQQPFNPQYVPPHQNQEEHDGLFGSERAHSLFVEPHPTHQRRLEEANQRYQQAIKDTNPDKLQGERGGKFYDFDSIAHETHSTMQPHKGLRGKVNVPYMVVYPNREKGDWRQEHYDYNLLRFCAKLPRERFEGYPENIRKYYANKPVELYLMVFEDVHYDNDNDERNLLLHPSVFPEYDPHHQPHYGMPENVPIARVQHTDEKGPRIVANIGMFEMDGVNPSGNIPQGTLRPNEVFIHSNERSDFKFSPRNAEFTLQKGKDVCRACYVVEARGKAKIYEIVYLRDSRTENGQRLKWALDNHTNVQEFSNMIGDAPWAQTVRRRLGTTAPPPSGEHNSGNL